VCPCVATGVRWDEHQHISDRILYFFGVWRKFARKPNMLRPEHLLLFCPISTLFRAYMSLVNLHASCIVSHHLFTIIYKICVTNIINITQTVFEGVIYISLIIKIDRKSLHLLCLVFLSVLDCWVREQASTTYRVPTAVWRVRSPNRGSATTTLFNIFD
jgi:hypothetical protein